MNNPETNKAVPDYETECDVCGQVPTVRIVDVKGKEVTHMEMCGVCTWGDSTCIDPGNW